MELKQRIKNLSKILKSQDCKVDKFDPRREAIEGQYAVLISNYDDKDKYTICHIVNNKVTAMHIANYSVSRLVKIIDLDNEEIIYNKINECPCHGQLKPSST